MQSMQEANRTLLINIKRFFLGALASLHENIVFTSSSYFLFKKTTSPRMYPIRADAVYKKSGVVHKA
jgi:hypothetical protein